MQFTSAVDQPPRRNARSFDLDDSATKAAAWVWHLHESKPGVTTEGRFLSSQSQRRSSSSSDRKISRFRQEATESTRTKGRGGMKFETPTWDCGSNLYDTFELVAFGNRLDRSLMEAVPALTSLPPPPPTLQAHANILAHEHHMVSPLHEPGGILRTLSLPRSIPAHGQTSKKKYVNCGAAAVDDANKVSLAKSRKLSLAGFDENQLQVPKRWPGVEKLMKAFCRKVAVLHKQVSINVGCKHNINIVEPGVRPLEPSISEKRDTNEPLANSKEGRVLSSNPAYCNGNDEDNLASSQRRINAYRRKSLDEGLLMSGRKVKHSYISEATNHQHAKEWSKPQTHASPNYHKHLHHHHHHHHHHYLHHTMASESARLSPETLSKLCADKGWLTS